MKRRSGSAPRRRTSPAPLGELRKRLGQKLRAHRESLGLSQTVLGSPHLTRAHISALELGKITPSMQTVAFLAARLGLGVADLLPDDLDPTDLEPDFSKMSGREVQAAHEMAVARSTARFLRSKGLRLAALRAGNPARSEPDALIDVAGRVMGIEVTCVGYYERGSREAADHAQDIWAPARGQPEKSRTLMRPGETVEDVLERAPVMVNFDKIIDFAQSLLNEKCGKKYSVPTILVIDACGHHVPLTTADGDGVGIARGLAVPDGCRLERVYLLMSHNFSGELEFMPIHLNRPPVAEGPE